MPLIFIPLMKPLFNWVVFRGYYWVCQYWIHHFGGRGFCVHWHCPDQGLLAKCANQFAKGLPDSDGVFALTHPPVIDAALKQVPVADIWGIGRNHSSTLKRHRIHTAYDFKMHANRQQLLKMADQNGSSDL